MYPYIHSPIHHLFTHPPTYSPSIHLPIHTPIHPPIHPPIHHLLACQIVPNWVLRDWHKKTGRKASSGLIECPPEGASHTQCHIFMAFPKDWITRQKINIPAVQIKNTLLFAARSRLTEDQQLLFEQHNWMSLSLNPSLYWFELIICAFVISWLPQPRSALQHCMTASSQAFIPSLEASASS
jgi:hypothetical protein